MVSLVTSLMPGTADKKRRDDILILFIFDDFLSLKFMLSDEFYSVQPHSGILCARGGVVDMAHRKI